MITAKKVLALLLFLCMVQLPSCGKTAQPEAEETEPEPTLRVNIIGEGVSYDVIKLDDVMLRLMGNWDSNSDRVWSYSKKLYFPENKSVYIDYFGPGRTTWVEVILRDLQNKNETVLLEWSYSGHYRQSSEPFLVCEIDERYALIHWRGWDADLHDDVILEYSLLDINTKKNIAIDFPSDFVPHFLDYNEGYLYFNSIGDEFYQGEFRPMCVKLIDSKSEKLEAAAVPEEVTITGRMSHYFISNGRYLAATDLGPLVIFDMEQRACIFRLECPNDSESIWYPRFHEDVRSEITRVQTECYQRNYNTSYLIEITLP